MKLLIFIYSLSNFVLSSVTMNDVEYVPNKYQELKNIAEHKQFLNLKEFLKEMQEPSPKDIIKLQQNNRMLQEETSQQKKECNKNTQIQQHNIEEHLQERRKNCKHSQNTQQVTSLGDQFENQVTDEISVIQKKIILEWKLSVLLAEKNQIREEIISRFEVLIPQVLIDDIGKVSFLESQAVVVTIPADYNEFVKIVKDTLSEIEEKIISTWYIMEDSVEKNGLRMQLIKELMQLIPLQDSQSSMMVSESESIEQSLQNENLP